MNSYKIPRGLLFDARLAVMARRSGLGRFEALALALLLFDCAGTTEPRGSVAGFDAEEAATLLELDMAKIEAALQALRDKQVILADGVFALWDKSQRLSTARVRETRARQQAAVITAPLQYEADSNEDPDLASRRRLENALRTRHQARGHALAEE